MRKLLLIISIFFLGTSFCLSQKFNVPFRKGNLWGFSDKSGKLKIEPKYDSVSIDYDNYRWIVFKDGKTGVVDSLGNEKLRVDYDSIYRNSLHSTDNDFYLLKGDKKGYSDIDGKIIFDCEYNNIIACDAMLFGKTYNFFIQKDKGDLWELQDYGHQVLISQIQEFKNLYKGNYKIKINNKWGFYNVTLKKWILNPEFEIIERLYKEDYTLKKENVDFKFYGKNGNTFFLIAENFNTKEFNSNYDDLFEVKKASNEIYESPFGLTGRKGYEKQLITGENFEEGKKFILDRNVISLIKKKNKFGLIYNIWESSFPKELEPVYDEIYLLNNKINETDYFSKNIVLIKNKKRWIIFDLEKFEPISSQTFEEIEIPENLNQIFFILKSKGLIGIFDYDDRKKANILIQPQYNKFNIVRSARSIDENYNSFKVYYFIKNGKICPVGENGIEFYLD